MSIENVVPNEDRLIVKQLPNPEMSKGGLHIPLNAKGFPTNGKVIAVGEGKWQNGVFVPTKIKVGEIVNYPEPAGTDFDFDGESYKVIRSSDINLCMPQDEK
jgi:chaperonin GroES